MVFNSTGTDVLSVRYAQHALISRGRSAHGLPADTASDQACRSARSKCLLGGATLLQQAT